MNDPHVKALIYCIVHGDAIDYSKAKPFSKKEGDFCVSIAESRVRFDFREHYATVEEACNAIAQYIRVWEFDATLESGNPDSFGLKLEDKEIIDRNPNPPIPGVTNLRVEMAAGSPTFLASLTILPADYPKPPMDIALNPSVETMHQRYMGYKQGREPLPAMAYFCQDIVRNNREKYQIADSVFRKIRSLSTNKGGSGARKADGKDEDLSQSEKQFLEQAIKTIIRRVAEKEHSPNKQFKKITLGDLPILPREPDNASK